MSARHTYGMELHTMSVSDVKSHVYGQQLITIKIDFLHLWKLTFLSVLFIGNIKLGIVIGTWKDGKIVCGKLGEIWCVLGSYSIKIIYYGCMGLIMFGVFVRFF